jgi:uncharacterized membrane protein YiaA
LASHEDETPKDLPVTWPFTVGGVLIIAALVIFCGHYAIRDPLQEKEGIENFAAIFWSLIVAAVVLMIAGGVYNVARNRRRLQREEHAV